MKGKAFLYQINFNRDKYPEICNELEKAKNRPGGIAWYLRELISKDIEQKRTRHISFQMPVQKPEKTIQESASYDEEANLPDDNGGFL